jgi:hypothetical protein
VSSPTRTLGRATVACKARAAMAACAERSVNRPTSARAGRIASVALVSAPIRVMRVAVVGSAEVAAQLRAAAAPRLAARMRAAFPHRAVVALPRAMAAFLHRVMAARPRATVGFLRRAVAALPGRPPKNARSRAPHSAAQAACLKSAPMLPGLIWRPVPWTRRFASPGCVSSANR